MIASPCKRCPLRNQSKDLCIKNCHRLQAVQELYVSLKEGGESEITSAIDYADEGRFSISSLTSVRSGGLAC